MAMSPLAQALAIQNQVNPTQSPIQPANVLGAYQLSSDVAEKNYQAKMQQMMGLWGGLASLGAAGILGYPALKKAFGTAAANAASPAAATAPTVTSGVDAATGAPIAASSTALPAETALSDAGAQSLVPAAAAPTIASDYGLTGAGTGATSLLGGDAAGAAGSIAADMGAGAGAAGADVAAATAPDWLTSILAFL